MTVLEGLAAVLLVLGSALVLGIVVLADRAEDANRSARPTAGQPDDRSLDRAA